MGISPTPPGLVEYLLSKVDERIARFAGSGFLRNATITKGGLTIAGGFLRVLYPAELGGRLGVIFGDLVNADTGDYLGTGLLIQDQEGNDIAQFRSDAATGQTRAILTGGDGSSVVTTDGVNGTGLGRPYLSSSLIPSRFADWTISTTSTTFVTLFTGQHYKLHAGAMGWARASMDTAGTTGEVRMLVDGQPLGDPGAIGFATSLRYFGPALVSAANADMTTVEIQARVASGAGAIRVGGGGVIGRPPS